MRKLTKKITRETLAVTSRQNAPVLVSLVPGDLLEFRVKGKRHRLEVSLAHCYNLAIIMDAEMRFYEARSLYESKVKAGKKGLRKPKRPQLPYSRIYFKAVT